jgi:primosomal protein N'
MASEQTIEATTPCFARVVLPIPVDQSFTYEVPATLAGEIHVGSRVEVPFGRRVLNGVVVELIDRSDVERIRPIQAIHETFASRELLELARPTMDAPTARPCRPLFRRVCVAPR